LGFLEKKQVVFFSAFADEYLKIKASGPTPVRSIRTVREHIAHLKDFFKEKPLSQITPEFVEEYIEKRASEKIIIRKKLVPKKGNQEEDAPARRMKGTTINRELSTLRNLFNIATKKNKFRGDNPVSDVDFFPERGRRHKILDPIEYNRLLGAADPRLRPIIQIAVRTGLRKNDILNLKRKEVDCERGVLTAWVSKVQEWQSFQIGVDLAETLKAIPELGEFLFTNPETKKAWINIDKWWHAAKKIVSSPARRFYISYMAFYPTKVAIFSTAICNKISLDKPAPRTYS
jgi:integrase